MERENMDRALQDGWLGREFWISLQFIPVQFEGDKIYDVHKNLWALFLTAVIVKIVLFSKVTNTLSQCPKFMIQSRY